jgi:hypothetical protein
MVPSPMPSASLETAVAMLLLAVMLGVAATVAAVAARRRRALGKSPSVIDLRTRPGPPRAE